MEKGRRAVEARSWVQGMSPDQSQCGHSDRQVHGWTNSSVMHPEGSISRVPGSQESWVVFSPQQPAQLSTASSLPLSCPIRVAAL